MASIKHGMGKGLGALLGEDFSMDTPTPASTLPITQIESCANQPRKVNPRRLGAFSSGYPATV